MMFLWLSLTSTSSNWEQCERYTVTFNCDVDAAKNRTLQGIDWFQMSKENGLRSLVLCKYKLNLE